MVDVEGHTGKTGRRSEHVGGGSGESHGGAK